MSFGEAGYVLSQAAGESLWFLDTRMTVKAGGAQTGGSFTFLEWSAPAGFGPPRHVHHREDEAFYLLSGSLTVECGEQRWRAAAGALIFLPHGIQHAFLCHEAVRGLQVTSPAGFENYIGEIGRAPDHEGLPDPSPPDLRRLLAAAERFGHDIVGPPISGDDLTREP
jgi:quercetin dioxygenase-like cupin family protein